LRLLTVFAAIACAILLAMSYYICSRYGKSEILQVVYGYLHHFAFSLCYGCSLGVYPQKCS